MAGSLGFGRQYCIPKGKASAEYRFVWRERLETKTATEFRYLRWGLGIVIALVLGLVTKVILDWLMRAPAMGRPLQRTSCRNVMAVLGQRWQAARKVASAIW
jgi:hypothetical protein